MESCGCVETNLCGRMKQYTDMADVNMGGIVEMALNNGVSRITGKQCSVQTGDPGILKLSRNFMTPSRLISVTLWMLSYPAISSWIT